MIHLDTNFLLHATITGSPAHTNFSIFSSQGEKFGISTVAWAEFLCGPLDAVGEGLARQILPSPEPLRSEDAEVAAKFFNKTGRRSRSLADCMIAAIANRCGARLATLNPTDFHPFVQHGLVLA